MAQETARDALAREVQRTLDASRLSVAAAARLWEVEPKRIYRWLKGDVSPQLDDIEAFCRAIDQGITLRIGPQTEEAPSPEWAKGLERRLALEVRANRETIVAALGARVGQAVAEALSGLQPQPPEEPAHADQHQEE